MRLFRIDYTKSILCILKYKSSVVMNLNKEDIGKYIEEMKKLFQMMK